MLEAFGVVVFVVYAAFSLLGLAMLWINAWVWWKAIRAKEGERVPSGFPFMGGFLCAVMVFLALSVVEQAKVVVPWRWFWILLPFLLDMLGLGGLLMYLLGVGRRARKDGPG